MTITIDPDSGEPPYEQVRRQISAGAADGSLAAGHHLPTVRGLAAELGLAVNTVAKAYRALESDGVVQTKGRAGTFVASRHLDDTEADAAAASFATVARRRGLSRDEAVRLLEQHWP